MMSGKNSEDEAFVSIQQNQESKFAESGQDQIDQTRIQIHVRIEKKFIAF